MIFLEAIGIVAFAVAGAAAAVRTHLDLFGVVVAATVTAIGGGIIRDILLGLEPPVGLATWWYLVACIATAVLIFSFYPRLPEMRLPLQTADAIGLALFAVTGATKAVEHGVPFYVAGVIGMLNGVGGGVIREMLMGQVPSIMREELYAIPALAGSLILALGHLYHVLPDQAMTLVAMLIIFAMRMAALLFKWNLPVRRLKKEQQANFLPRENDSERTVQLPVVLPGPHGRHSRGPRVAPPTKPRQAPPRPRATAHPERARAFGPDTRRR